MGFWPKNLVKTDNPSRREAPPRAQSSTWIASAPAKVTGNHPLNCGPRC